VLVQSSNKKKKDKIAICDGSFCLLVAWSSTDLHFLFRNPSPRDEVSHRATRLGTTVCQRRVTNLSQEEATELGN
jgi:hypothetical protein